MYINSLNVECKFFYKTPFLHFIYSKQRKMNEQKQNKTAVKVY